jgi:DNA-binding CsgD family transcriptional regulator
VTARQAISRALDIVAGCGAHPLEERAHQLRRQLGIPTSVAARPTVARLTRREEEIADMIEAGHSNADIAQRLFLSGRTVETHVSRNYAKLGVGNRAAAVSRLAQRTDRPGRVPQPPRTPVPRADTDAAGGRATAAVDDRRPRPGGT